MVEGEVFTIDYETTQAFGGKPGVLYYGFIDPPGELFKADRCKRVDNAENLDRL